MEVQEFLSKQNRPSIVFCNELLVHHLNKKFITVENSDILQSGVLDKLETKYQGQYRVLVVTQFEFMRAIDYRAPNLGIALVIAKSFSNPRQAQQGLGRVGRNGDKAVRVILKGVPLVDGDEDFKYRTSLNEYHSNTVAKTF